MIDIKLFRENPELVRQGLKNKNAEDKVDTVLKLDQERRDLIMKTDELKSKRNQASSQIPQLKKAGQDTSAIMAEMKRVSDEITQLDGQLREVETKLNDILMTIPNLAHSSVPVGRSAEDNVEARRWVPQGFKFENDFKPMDHIELGKKLNILDFERGAKISGSGFPVYVGKGATLERALINYMLDLHINNHGYKEIFPPFFG
ncbi:MAG TPA: hypothetical protein VHO28_03845 [Ignavibacteriales bacterium]|nr:hypothetical protein [Ignavibacteriales bacterium]